MNNKKLILACKHVVYTLLLFLLYILQTTPGFLTVGGLRPMWVLPAAVVIAMLEGEFIGGIYGAVAGLLCDTGAVPRSGGGSVLFGFNGFLMCLLCVTIGLLIIYLFHCNLLGCMLITAVVLVLRGSLEYLFAYGMWGHHSGWKLYVLYTLPTVILTLVITPLLFWALRRIHLRFDAALRS